MPASATVLEHGLAAMPPNNGPTNGALARPRTEKGGKCDAGGDFTGGGRQMESRGDTAERSRQHQEQQQSGYDLQIASSPGCAPRAGASLAHARRAVARAYRGVR